MIIYLWALQGMRSEGWIACLVYAVACLLRLARFNIGNRLPAKDFNSFQGAPLLAGALLVMLPIYLSNTLGTPACPMPAAPWQCGWPSSAR